MIITEILNDLPTTNPIRERMDVYIPKINENLPRRNGFVYALVGSGDQVKVVVFLNHINSIDVNLIIFIILLLNHHLRQLKNIHSVHMIKFIMI